MNIDQAAVDRAVAHALALCAIPSPSGMTAAAASYVEEALGALGLSPERTRKGAVLCRLGGEGRPLVLAAHFDTLGAVVRSVKSNGRLRYSKIGGFPDLNLVGETCLVHCRDGRSYSGTFQPVEASVHVNQKLKELKPDEDSVEILVDELVRTREETLALGIAPGDFVSIDARARLTPSGFLKSRHLDDKAASGILLALAGLVAGKTGPAAGPADSGARPDAAGAGKAAPLRPGRSVSLLFTAHEEVGHGGAPLPEGIEEFVSVDMGAVGEDLSCDERMVSICAKDSRGPYDFEVTTALVEAAKRAGCSYAVDVYPSYGSDADAALAAGHDLRHGLVGPGVYASHGYERTHRDAIANTLALLAEYLRA